MKKIIIAGADSFIAKSFVKQVLYSEDYKIYLVCRNNRFLELYKSNHNVETVYSQLSDYPKLYEQIRNIDIFISFAWEGMDDKNDSLKHHNSRELHYKCIKNLIKYSNLKKIVLIGSSLEYGSHSDIKREDIKSIPDDNYGKEKFNLYCDIKNLCEREYTSLDYVEARLFSVYGVGDKPKRFIPNLIENLINNNTIPLTECKQIWNFAYVEDVAEGLFSLVDNNVRNGIYNVSSNEYDRLSNYIEKMRLYADSSSRLLYGEVKYRNMIVPNMICCCQKIREMTGWEAKTKFEEGMKKTIDELKCVNRANV